MDDSAKRRQRFAGQALLILGAVLVFLPCGSGDRGYRFIGSSVDDTITLPPLSNGWRPVLSTASWRQSSPAPQHPVHGRLQQHLRTSQARKQAQAAGSNKVEVYAPAPPSILGSFSLVAKPRDKKKVVEQEELLPQGRIVYSARLVPPPVRSSSSDDFNSGEERPYNKGNDFSALTPPAESSKTYYNRPGTVEHFPSTNNDPFPSQQQSGLHAAKYEVPHFDAKNNFHSSFPTAAKAHKHGIYLAPSQNYQSPQLSGPQTFKALPDTVQFFKDFFEKHKAAYSEALLSQQQSFLEEQKRQPVIESVELGKEVFYGKDVNIDPFNNYNGKLFYQSAKNPSEIEIVNGKRPETGQYSIPAPENFNNKNNFPVHGTNTYKYQDGVLTTSPFSNPSHVYTAPTPLPLIRPTFPTNSLPAFSTFHPQIKEEFKLSPVQFSGPTSVTLQPQGENGRIPRPYINDKWTKEKFSDSFTVTNGHAPAQHAPHKISADHNEKDTYVTFLPTIPPELQTQVPDQGYEDGITLPHSTLNEITHSTPIPEHGRVTFKQSPVDPMNAHSPLTSVNSFGVQKLNRPPPTRGYKESEQPVFGTLKSEPVTFINEVSTAEPTKETSLPEVSRPHTRNRQRTKHRRPNINLDSTEQKDFQRQRNPQRTRNPSDITHHVQNQQYLSSAPDENENGYMNGQKIPSPHNHQLQVSTDTAVNDKDTDENVKHLKARPNRNRRPPVHQNEYDYSEESKTEDNIHSSTHAYHTRRPEPQSLVRDNFESEDTHLQEQSVDKQKAYSSRKPNAQTQHSNRNNEQSTTRSPHISRRRPQTQRENTDVRDRDAYRTDQNFGYQGTRTHHTRRPSSNRGQASYYNTNGYANKEYNGIRGRPSHRQRPIKHDMTETSEIEGESERQTEKSVSQKHRTQASNNQVEADNSNTYVYNRRRKPASSNYNYSEQQEEVVTNPNQETNDDIMPGSPTLTNEVTSQNYPTTARPTRRYPPTQKLNRERYNAATSTHSGEISDLPPVTRLPSYETEIDYNQAESLEHSYQANYKTGQDNIFSTNIEHKNVGKSTHSAFMKDSVHNHEDGSNEFSPELTTAVEPSRPSATSASTTTTTTTTTTAPTSSTPPPTTTSSTTTTTTEATTSIILPTTLETDSPPSETSTSATTSTSTETHSPLYTPYKLRPRLRGSTNSSRPKFSIKEYRQRLNNQNENEAQDDIPDKNDDERSSPPYHSRYHTRTRGSESYRREPSGSTTEATKTRYRSGDHPRTSSTRFRTSTSTKRPEYSSEKTTSGFRPSTSRYKPGSGKFYSRYRSTTPSPGEKFEVDSTNNVSSTTPRIVMNPKGVFSAMRRIYPLKKLTSGQRNTSVEGKPAKLGASDIVHTLPPTFVITPQSTEEVSTRHSTEQTSTEQTSTERVSVLTPPSMNDHTQPRYDAPFKHTSFQSFVGQNSHSGMENAFSSVVSDENKPRPTTTTAPLSDPDPIQDSPTPGTLELQSPSQIVAGLTFAGTASGQFKSATSLSPRPALRITMATEDPKLPIEAFFPVLSNKD